MSIEQNECGLIKWFRKSATEHSRLALGIGDDTAVLQLSESSQTLITVDMLMEGTHFSIPPATPKQVGRKALAVNLSDIAAMGGRPVAAVVSVALARDHGMEFARELHQGLQELAAEFDVAIAGGDTNIWDHPLVVSVTVLGETTGSRAVTRSGAQPGDWIMVTGDLGGSLLGGHLNFRPRVHEAMQLHANIELNAMIDLSDGLARDLHHVLTESGIAAVLESESIPISQIVKDANDNRSPLEHALCDGEDFELLFTLSESDGAKLLADSPIDVPISHIGHIVEGEGCQIRDLNGKQVSLPIGGWEHLF